MKKYLIISGIIMLLSNSMKSQQYHSCPIHEQISTVYENPLYDQYLSKYDVKFYHLSLEASNIDTYLKGFTTIKSESLEPLDTIVLQLIDELTIDSVRVGESIQTGYLHENDVVYIPLIIDKGEVFDVTIYYNGEASQDRGFFAGITSKRDAEYDQWVTYTLSEPLNARDWFPVKQVLTDKADSVWVDVTVDKNLMAGSVGVLKEIEDVPGNKHKFKWRSRYPIAYYLISIAVADYMDYSIYANLSGQNDSVLVQNYIYNDPDYLDFWKAHIDMTSDMITLFSELVIDYPFAKEKYGHAVAPMGGGMEHQTMTTLANFNFTLVAHELAHQWFGDNITCGTWQDIWINEGFASYFEYIALEHIFGKENANNWMEASMNIAFAETGSVYVPEEEAENVSRVFDYGLTYKKGAALLHMLRYELDNDSVFYKIMKDYSLKFTDNNATAVDFIQVLDSISGKDFSCFFDQWYYGKGFPTFKLLWHKNNDTLYIESLQETTSLETPLFKMHFDINIRTDNDDIKVRLYQEENHQVFAIPMDKFVWGVAFDPEKYLLARSSVEMFIPESEADGMVIGPNPFTEFVVLKMKHANGTEIYSLVNSDGRLVKEGYITTNPFRIDLKELGNGPFFLKVEGDWGTFREKIIKVNGR